MVRDEIKESINIKRIGFINTCLDLHKGISNIENDESESLLFEKEKVKNEIQSLNKQNNALQNSLSAFVEEVLEDLGGFISALEAEIHGKHLENEKVIKEIDELKATILSVTSSWGSVRLKSIIDDEFISPATVGNGLGHIFQYIVVMN